jgi:hypothetical protein
MMTILDKHDENLHGRTSWQSKFACHVSYPGGQFRRRRDFIVIERRKTERLAMRGLAKVRTSSGGLPRDCWVTDISDGGARLFAEAVEIPDQFTLVFADASCRPRECRAVWRLGHEVGAEFVDGTEFEYARRAAGGRQR